MFDRQAVVDQFFERIDADLQMHVQIVLCNLLVACSGLDAFGDHGLVRNQQQRAGRDFVVKAGAEQRGGFHVHGHGADLAQIFLEIFVMLPYAPVGGVDRAGPVILVVVADGGRDGLLQVESG